MHKLVFATMMVAAMAASAEMKFGTVDLMVLVRNHSSYERDKALLSSTDKDYQKKLELIKSDGDKLQEEGRKLMEQLENPMLADAAKADVKNKLIDIQKKLMGVEQKYRADAAHFRQELQDLESRLLKATTDDLRKSISKFAEANGFDFIFDANATTYAKPSYNVTDAILKEMGVNPKDAKGRNEGK